VSPANRIIYSIPGSRKDAGKRIASRRDAECAEKIKTTEDTEDTENFKSLPRRLADLHEWTVSGIFLEKPASRQDAKTQRRKDAKTQRRKDAKTQRRQENNTPAPQDAVSLANRINQPGKFR